MISPVKKKIPAWLVVVAAIIVPGSGHVIIGRATRGLLMLFWMFVLGFITFQLTNENISIIGRLSGGIAVWALSILEAYRLARRR